MSRQPFKCVERALSQDALTTTAAISSRMARVRQRGTSPELSVRRALYTLGVRYRTHNRDLPGSPDLANRSQRWALFVHGCYWHRHYGCVKATTPRSNTAFWKAKFARNVERDGTARAALLARGFSVVTVWQCETANADRLLQYLRENLTPAAGR